MATSGRKKRILVVDDEPDVVTYMVTLLSDSGYETVSARNGKAGMDLAREETPDLVTLDISMPESSGTRFYKEFKADPALAGIPVVVVTAVTGKDGDPYAFKKIISDGQNVAAPEGYFTKPIDREEFLTTIAKLLS